LLVENGALSHVLLFCSQMLIIVSDSAVIVDDPAAHLQPDLSSLESWNNDQHESFRKQIVANEAKAAKKENSRSLSEDAMKKRKEREERKRFAAKKLEEESKAEDGETAFLTTDDSQPEVPAATAQEPQLSTSGQLVASANYTITIPAASEYQWYSSDQSTFTTIESAQQVGVWTYPANLKERARCGVFRSLWTQGYFMGGGIKFGGDFLVYPGSPALSPLLVTLFNSC
jgi:tRNA-splicing endonuclease subunit Sen34